MYNTLAEIQKKQKLRYFGVVGNTGTFNFAFGATLSAIWQNFNRQNLFGNIGRIFIQCFCQFFIIGLLAKFYAVGNVKVFILAQSLHQKHKVARHTFTLKLVCNISIQSQHCAVIGKSQSGNTFFHF